MAFYLDKPADLIHIEVSFSLGDEQCRIIGVFNPLPTNKEMDAFIKKVRGIQRDFEANEDYELLQNLKESAESVFVRWVNPEGRPDLWVTNKDGQPLECTDKWREEFLARRGVPSALCEGFIASINSKAASLGNSGRSPASGPPPTESQPSPTS